jgi:protein-S-isoprenylcysteine O-methyltransferase Ste14
MTDASTAFPVRAMWPSRARRRPAIVAQELPRGGLAMNLKKLVGSGDRIALVTSPIVIAGVALNVMNPALFRVGGPPTWLAVVSVLMLIPGVAIWIWSAVLIVVNVPRGRLITDGPYAWASHPLYTAVALLVLPWAGFLLDTWVGVPIGITLYGAARWFAPDEEAALARTFGSAWQAYRRNVRLGWL